MTTKEQKRLVFHENEKYFTRVSVKLCNSKDMDIIMKLSEKESKNDYIKQLIRKDIETSGYAENHQLRIESM